MYLVYLFIVNLQLQAVFGEYAPLHTNKHTHTLTHHSTQSLKQLCWLGLVISVKCV